MTFAPEAHKTAGVLARRHAIELEQCSLFIDSPHLRKAMTDAAAFLKTLSTPSVPAVHKDAGALSKFAKWAITEGPFTGGDLSGGEVQDKAVELGLLREVSYNPAEHGASNYGLEPGDSWFVFAGPLRDRLPPPQPPGASPAGDDPKALDAAPVRYVRHKKAGGTYEVVGIAKMQAAMWAEVDEYGDHLGNVDMREVVVYRSVEHGALWVRPVAEFNDDRFEDVPAPERFAEARSSSTEAVEQEVERLRCGLEGAREAIAVAMADLSAKGWHHSERPCQTLTDASIAIRKLLARPSPAPAACKPEGEAHG